MQRVTGIGGIFFKARDPAGLREWYAKHLGLPCDQYGYQFEWRDRDDPTQRGFTVWAPFAEGTQYFAPSEKPFMFNFRVTDLDAVLEALRREGVPVDDKIVEEENGRFGWVMDPEGHRIELWEPADAPDL